MKQQNEIKDLKHIIKVLNHLRDIDIHMSLTQALIFLMVCDEPGITMYDIQITLNSDSGVISHCVKKLCLYKDKEEVKGHDLLKKEQVFDKLALHLTKKGEALKAKILT